MHQNYPLYGMARIGDIFCPKDDYSWVKGNGNVIKTYGTINKRGLAVQVFHAFMHMAQEDIVENNTVLKLPLYDGALLIEQIPPEVMRRRREEGKMRHFSEIFARGKGYDMIYRFKKKGKFLRYRAIMGQSLFKRFTRLVNSGKTYFGIAREW